MDKNIFEYAKIDSKFGEIVCIWEINKTQLKIKRILLSNRESINEINRSAVSVLKHLFPTAKLGANPIITNLFEEISDFLQGKRFDITSFPHESLDFDQCWGKQALIIKKESQISLGKISTYALLAENCGIPRGARVAARALAQNPFPLIIPCHRTVRSDGDLGGYQGGLAMKQFLLENEGISCKNMKKGLSQTLKYQILNWNDISNSIIYDFKDSFD